MYVQDERKKADMASERSRMIKLFRSTLQERGNYSRESRLARNRAVSKTHERLARDAHKAKDDDKGRRMDALKVSQSSPAYKFVIYVILIHVFWYV